MPKQPTIKGRVTRIKPRSETMPTPADLKGWRIAMVTIGYMPVQAVIGQPLTVSIGVNNFSDLDLTLNFPNSQKVSLKVFGPDGRVLYSSPAPSGAGSTLTVKSLATLSWTAEVDLDAGAFRNGVTYQILGSLLCDYQGSASVALVIP